MNLYPFVRPFAFALDAERAHRATIAALKLIPGGRVQTFPSSLRTSLAGLEFDSPLGLAAGFDKNAEVPNQMLRLGFGFVEVGTLTPRPQTGNERPRLFRLREDRAVINRMGFNNEGQSAALKRLKDGRPSCGIIGVNVGANKDSRDRIKDYVEGVKTMGPVADFLTINISSPNTPGLRGLQDEGALTELLSAIASLGSPKPIFLKVAPDLDLKDPERIVRASIDHKIAAVIVSNTTISRPALQSPSRGERGGLSGRPLKALALQSLRRFRQASAGEIALIGVGGIENANDAFDRIRAGANLIQLYSAMVYEGPSIARTIAFGLATCLERAGFSNIAEAVGTE